MSDQVGSGTEKRRKPWIAGLLTFISPGLGHLYAGSWPKFIRFYILFKLAVLVFLTFFLLWIPLAKVNIILGMLIPLGLYIFIIRDSIQVARQMGNGYQLKLYNKWYVFIPIVGIILFADLLLQDSVNHYLGKGFKILGGSMAPTLLVGDHVLVDKVIYRVKNPERYDLVSFPYPEDESKIFLKRIVGMPGDDIQIKEKKVFLNGELVNDEDYTQRIDPGIVDGRANPRDNFGPITVPAGSYFVMGDNRDQSLDSRFWGFVRKEKILGKVTVIYWSWNSKGPWTDAVRWDRIGNRI